MFPLSYLIFNFFILLYAFLDLKINDYILLNFILFIYLLFLTGPQGQQCYTLMGFSILYKNSLLLLLLLLLFPLVTPLHSHPSHPS